MFIDLHCHTKNAKTGDAKREVDSEKFLEVMQRHGVGIVAITNHNMFCKAQFDEFSNLDENLLVWPGVELDVYGNKSGSRAHGHVIVISNPKYVANFDSVLKSKIGDTTPDDFSIDIDSFVALINMLDECLVICHYMKTPELSTEDINFLRNSLVGEDKIVMLEPTNARKAALVYYDNGQQSWFGSDVTDWDYYPNDKVDFKLPECKFDIKSFEKFFYLLKKNRGTVLASGYLDPKKSDLIHIELFDDLKFDYQIFNDVNVIFGGKATAKTSILKKLEEYYLSKSKTVSSYYVEQKEKALQNLVVKKPSEAAIFSFSSVSSKNDFDFLKGWKWSELPSLSQFYKSEESSQKNAIINKLKISKAVFTDTLLNESFVAARNNYCNNLETINNFISIGFSNYLNKGEEEQLSSLIKKIIAGEKQKYYEIASEYYSKYLEKWTIGKIKTKLSVANSTISRPLSTGLSTFFTDYEKLKIHLHNLKTNSKQEKEITPFPIVGSIPFKGNVYRRVLIGFPPQKQSEHKEKTGGARTYLYNQNKSNFDSIKQTINKIDLSDSTDNIAESIQTFVAKAKELNANSLVDFLNYSIFLATDTKDDFLPSNGVTSILLVEAALQNDNSDVIILDEPDSGMGADFINDELITRINYRAKENKIIIIATHDPNLVVRTHPFSCLYREEIGNEIYSTYVGSSFDEELVDVCDANNVKLWVDACVDKCEGGHSALNERIKTYGKK